MELQRRQPTYKKIRQVLESILAEGRAPKLDDLRMHFPSVECHVLSSLWQMDSDRSECEFYASSWLQENFPSNEDDFLGNIAESTLQGSALNYRKQYVKLNI